MESLYDYGARTGFWRLKRLFVKEQIPCTVFAVGMALERHPPVCAALRDLVNSHGWEVASHGYRWIDYQNVAPETELEHIVRTVDVHERLLGRRPVGLYQGKVRQSWAGWNPFTTCVLLLESVRVASAPSTCHPNPLSVFQLDRNCHSPTFGHEIWSLKWADSNTILIRMRTICRIGVWIMINPT